MEKTPVIFFAFANDDARHLPLLEEEVRMLFDELEDYDRQDYLKIHRKENANLDDLFDGFTRYKDQIVIFHYGGHAGGTGLQLKDGVANADGLAGLIGQQENLQLVFLNGCATKDQVKLLWDVGVKAVIATSVEIKDDLAVKFAQRFYDALAKNHTIEEAFEVSESFLKADSSTPDLVKKQFRGFVDLASDNLSEIDENAWALYLNPKNRDKVMKWRLPKIDPLEQTLEELEIDFNRVGVLEKYNCGRNQQNKEFWDKMDVFDKDDYLRTIVIAGEQDQSPLSLAKRFLLESVDYLNDVERPFLHDSDLSVLEPLDLSVRSRVAMENRIKKYQEKLTKPSGLSKYKLVAHVLTFELDDSYDDIIEDICPVVWGLFEEFTAKNKVSNLVFIVCPYILGEEGKNVLTSLEESLQQLKLKDIALTPELSKIDLKEDIEIWFRKKLKSKHYEKVQGFIETFIDKKIGSKEIKETFEKEGLPMEKMELIQEMIFEHSQKIKDK